MSDCQGQMLVTVWSCGNVHTLLIGLSIGSTTLEKVWIYLSKLKRLIYYDLIILEMHKNIHKMDTSKNILSNIICDSLQLETAQCLPTVECINRDPQ